MLNNMRGGGQSKSMWVIMGLLMFGLTFGFGLDSFRGANVTIIGSVGDEEIEVNVYGRAYQNAFQRLSQQIGRAPTSEELKRFDLKNKVLDLVSAQAALDNETATIGLSVGDNIVRDSIRSSAKFQGLNGSFDNESYRYFLESQVGISANQFETRVRKENARALLQNTVLSGVSNNEIMALTLLNFTQQKRSFEWAALREKNLTSPVANPKESELEAFYNARKADYMTPQTRKITYAWLNPDDLLDQVNINETEIRESYNMQADRFNREEQREVDRVVYPTMEDAQTARDRLETSLTNFSELIADRGLLEADVNLGEVVRGKLSADAADLVFSQTEPGVVGPVESTLGPALFRINAIISADNTPFEEVRDELRTELAGERARRLVADLVDEIDDELAAGIELEELSKIPGLQVGTINFNEKSNHPLADYEAFRSAAYASQKEDFAEILDLSDGGVFALRLDSIEEPTQIAQAAIGAKLEDDFKVAQTNEALMKLAKQVKPDLESGGNLDSRDVKLETVENITRNSYIETLPPRAITKVFEMELGDVSLIETSGTVFLVRLTKINNFDPDQKDNQLVLNEVKQQIDAQISLDILDYYSESLQSKVGVTLNRNVIEQVNLQITGVEPTGY